jgi:hypothetical protein
MEPKTICPTCRGRKIVPGNCECNAEWRSLDSDEMSGDCRCEPEKECPDCKGFGYIEEI